jgi:hypothetical protein
VPVGASFGVPWPRGAIQKDQRFALTRGDGSTLPVQTWPLAYWPDGSIKWIGVATVAGPETAGELKLTPAAQAESAAGPQLQIQRSDTTFEINTGRVKLRLAKTGSRLIDSIAIDGREVARNGVLTCIAQEGADGDLTMPAPRQRYLTRVDQVTLEQSGPVRAVVNRRHAPRRDQ